MVSLAQGLVAQGVDLSIFALNTSKHFVPKEEAEGAAKGYKIVHQFIDNRIRPWPAIRNLLGKKPFHVTRFFSHNAAVVLSQLLNKQTYDVIIFESVFMAPYLDLVRSKTNALLVLRSHNVEYLIWERVCGETRNPLKRWYLSVQTKRLKEYEISVSGQFSLVAAITAIDAGIYKRFLPMERVTVVPFGILPSIRFGGLAWEKEGLVLGFLGSMDWLPNEDAVRWFVKDVWPLVLATGCGARAILAGRGMPHDLLASGTESLRIIGTVSNAGDFWAGIHLGIAPLRSGSGVRIKVLECMALGIPVLSTSIGCEGIAAVPNREIIIADDAEAFAQAIMAYTYKKDELRRVGLAAQKFIEREHAPKAAAARLLLGLPSTPLTA